MLVLNQHEIFCLKYFFFNTSAVGKDVAEEVEKVEEVEEEGRRKRVREGSETLRHCSFSVCGCRRGSCREYCACAVYVCVSCEEKGQGGGHFNLARVTEAEEG